MKGLVARAWRGLQLGAFGGLFLFALAYGSAAAARLGINQGDLAVVYILGGAAGGFLGGLLWPFQRTRFQSLVFAVPTAVAPALLVGVALGLTVRMALLLAVVGGVGYAAVFGARDSG